MSFLSTIGKDVKSVFAWLGSPKGQAVIATGEAVATTIDPSLTGIFTLANSWIQKVIETESLAAAAGEQTGSGTQKAAAVMSAMGPEISKYFPAATATEIANANTAIVAFLNAFDSPPASTGNAAS
jgi:hypothetical protein